MSSLLATQAHQKAKIWRTKRFPLFDSIQIIVDGIIATGANTFRAGVALQTPPATEAIPDALDDDETNLSGEDGQNSDEVCFPSFSLTHPFNLCMF
jgi:hypothetical protein